MEVVIDYKEREKEEKELLNKAMQARVREVSKEQSRISKPIEKKPVEKKTYEKRENAYKREPKAENAI